MPGGEYFIFFSMDLEGATAFKEKEKDWVSVVGDFIARAPDFLRESWRSERDELVSKFRSRRDVETTIDSIVVAEAPNIWKTVGDEVVFIKNLSTENHAEIYCALRAFVSATEKATLYVISKSGRRMAVKGSAWIADKNRNRWFRFQIINPVTLKEEEVDADIGGVAQEAFEVIGPSVDAGFRICKYSSKRKFTLSIELALLWAVAANELKSKLALTDQPLGRSMIYAEGEVLKGVFDKDGTPYPRIQIRVNIPEETEHSKRHRTSKHYQLISRADINLRDLEEVCEEWIKNYGYRLFDPRAVNKESPIDEITKIPEGTKMVDKYIGDDDRH